MSTIDNYPGQTAPTPDEEARINLHRIITELEAAGESMEGNRPLWDEELLHHIRPRLDIFQHEPEAAVVIPGYKQGNVHLFVPANDQLEGLLAISSEYNNRRELSWRVVHRLDSFEGSLNVFWECTLENTERGGPVVVLEQYILRDEQVTPELVRSYLRHELEYYGEVLSSMTPELMALVNAVPGATVSAHYQGEDIGSSGMRVPVDKMREWFYQPE